MIINDRDFKARLDENKTIELLGKHTNPIKNFILPTLVKVNYYANKDGEEPIIANELNQLILYVAKQNGLSITEIEEKQYRIKPKTLLKNIRECFDFGDEYTTSTTKDETFKTVKTTKYLTLNSSNSRTRILYDIKFAMDAISVPKPPKLIPTIMAS